jgi:hypothetical protein
MTQQTGTLSPEYVRQRLDDPDYKVRDVGLAIAGTFGRDSRLAHAIAWDSETVRERIGEVFLHELERAGYAVTFVGGWE